MIDALIRVVVGTLLSVAVPMSSAFANVTPSPVVDRAGLFEQIESATRAGRLVQADAMLTWLEQENAEGVSDAVAFQRAEYHMAKGDVENAATSLGRAGVNSGDLCRRSRLTGWIAGKTAEWSKAILQLASAIEQCSEDPSLWNLIGLALVGKGEYSASLEAFDSALQLEPRHPGLFNNRAMAHVSAGQPNLAMTDLRHALALDPEDPAIRDNVDYLSGVMGNALVRAPGDSDALWAARLAKAGEGAQGAGHGRTAMAYFANAALLLDRFDAQIWAQGMFPAKRKAD
jgi:Flp pilus assembly protein TadD